MKDKILSLIRGEIGRGTIIITIGNLANAFFSFVFVYLTSQALSSFDFGLFSICLTSWFLLVELSDFGISNLTISLSGSRVRRDEIMANIYFKIGFLFRILQGVIIFGLFLFFGQYLAIYLGQGELAPLFLIFAGGIFWFLILSAFLPVVLVYKKFLLYAFIFIFQGVGRILLFFIIQKLKILNLMTISIVFASLPFLDFLLIIIIFPVKFLTMRIKKKYFYQVLGYIKWLIVYGFFGAISNRINVYFLTKINGPKEAGVYNLAYLFASVFLLFSSSFSTVFLPKISQLKNESKVRNYFIKALKVIFLLVIAMMVTTLPIKIIIDFLLNQKYPGTGLTFLLLMPGMIFLVLTVPATNILWVLNQPKVFTLVSFVQLILSLLFNFLFIRNYGLNGAAISYSLVSLCTCLLTNYFVLKNLKMRL